MNDSDIRRRCNSVEKWCQEEAYQFVQAEWAYRREKLLNDGKQAVEAGQTEKAAYFMAILDGFDRAVNQIDWFRHKYAELLKTDQEKPNDE